MSISSVARDRSRGAVFAVLAASLLEGCQGPSIPDPIDATPSQTPGGASGAGGGSASSGGAGGSNGASGGASGASGAGGSGGTTVASAGGSGASGASGSDGASGSGGASSAEGGASGTSGSGGGSPCGSALYDAANCGVCGHACAPGVVCTRGVCGREIGPDSTRYYSLVTTPAGRTYGWGVNGDSALGIGTSSDQTTLQWSTELPVLRVTVGRCGIDHDGGVMCWGTNDEAELGIGTFGGPDPTSGMPNTGYFAPQKVSLPRPAIDLTYGGYWDLAAQICALLDDHTAYCWGSNEGGLIDPSSGASFLTSPTKLDLPPVAEIVAGRGFTCVILDGGDLECWGALQGVAIQSDAPTKIASDIVAIDAGEDRLLAIDVHGDVYCAGSNPGCGTGSSGISDFVNVPGLPSPALAVSVGGGCALLDVGDVWCWGQYLALTGDGASCDVTGIVPPTKTTLTSIVEIAGNTGAIVARDTDGNIWTLGSTWDPPVGCVGTKTLRNPPPE